MLNPEREVLNELEDFVEEGLEGSGAGRMVYEEIYDKIGELKYRISREYNTVIT